MVWDSSWNWNDLQFGTERVFKVFWSLQTKNKCCIVCPKKKKLVLYCCIATWWYMYDVCYLRRLSGDEKCDTKNLPLDLFFLLALALLSPPWTESPHPQDVFIHALTTGTRTHAISGMQRSFAFTASSAKQKKNTLHARAHRARHATTSRQPWTICMHACTYADMRSISGHQAALTWWITYMHVRICMCICSTYALIRQYKWNLRLNLHRWIYVLKLNIVKATYG
jgi:hypothetical protein